VLALPPRVPKAELEVAAVLQLRSDIAISKNRYREMTTKKQTVDVVKTDSGF
jgi:hypothetical protein